MRITKEKACNTTFIHLTNQIGMEICLCSRGASLYYLKLNGVELTSAPEEKEIFLTDQIKFCGQTIGPVPLRLKDGKYKAKDKEYAFQLNEPGKALHSSNRNFGYQEFGYEVLLGEKSTEVRFSLNFTPLPSEAPAMKVLITYTIAENAAEFDLDYDIVPESDALINPTNHIYWQLGEKDVSNLSLKMPAKKHLEYNEVSLVLPWTEEAKREFDFNELDVLGHYCPDGTLDSSSHNGFDHFFFLESGDIHLESEKYRLNLTTGSQGVQIYTSNYPVTSIKMRDGRNDCLRNALTLETLNDPRPGKTPITAANEHFKAHNHYHLEKKA